LIEQDDLVGQSMEYRDTVNGDQVKVIFWVSQKGDVFKVKDIEIKDVKKAELAQDKDETREYSDEEILAFMDNYMKSQTKFTSYLNLFHKEANKMRKLELIEQKKKVRRMGILYIDRADFRDLDSGEFIGVDISVKNKKGVLEIQALRIREVKRP